MKKRRNKSSWLWLACLGFGWGFGDALAQESVEIPSDEPIPVVEESGSSVVLAPATNEEPSAVETPVAGEPAPPPQKVAPGYRGSDMGEAFTGASGSRFGVHGRVNKMPVKKTPKKEKGAWRRNVELGVNTSRGNSDTLRYNAALSGSKETENNYYFLKAAARYGESDGETDAENATGEAKYQRRLSERMYAALDGNARHDQLANLSYRVRGSLSLGRHFIWTDRTVLNLEAGPGYVVEKKGGGSEGFVAGRVAQYLEFLITDSLQVWQSVEIVQNLEDSSAYFVNSEVGLETVLRSNLSLRFGIEDRYDSSPAAGKAGNDLLTTTSLNWSF